MRCLRSRTKAVGDAGQMTPKCFDVIVIRGDSDDGKDEVSSREPRCSLLSLLTDEDGAQVQPWAAGCPQARHLARNPDSCY